MSIHKYLERLRITDHHINTRCAGNIKKLADKLGLSQSGAYTFLAEIKEEGFPIAYSKRENRFYYSQKGKMIGYVFVKDADDNNDDLSDKSRGGGGKNFLKLFSNYTYSRNWAGNFVLSFSQ